MTKIGNQEVVATRPFSATDRWVQEHTDAVYYRHVGSEWWESASSPGEYYHADDLAIADFADQTTRVTTNCDDPRYLDAGAIVRMGSYRKDGLERIFGRPELLSGATERTEVWSSSHINEIERTVVAPAAELIRTAFTDFTGVESVVASQLRV